MVVIVDYKVGNILNVQNALKRVGLEPVMSSNPEEIMSADIVILPGVGAFKDAMDSLRNSGLDEVLKKRASENKMIIGICLGMQLLFDRSFEDGQWEGLGILKGDLERFNLKDKSLKVPHMGWNTLYKNREDDIIKDFKEGDYVYFVHSYYLTNYDEEDLVMYSTYEETVPAIVRKGNVIGMQFHPEKSGAAGAILINNIKSILEELENKGQIKIFPAIDIKNGKCVRLLLGDKDKETVYFENPIEAAKFLKKDGAKRKTPIPSSVNSIADFNNNAEAKSDDVFCPFIVIGSFRIPNGGKLLMNSKLFFNLLSSLKLSPNITLDLLSGNTVLMSSASLGLTRKAVPFSVCP